MRWRLAIISVVVLLALERAYSVGHANGLRSAPEWAAARQHEADVRARIWEQMDEDYTDEARACDRILEAAEDLKRLQYSEQWR